MSSTVKAGIPVALVGLIVLIVGIFVFNNTRVFLADSLSATGIMVDFDSHRHENRDQFGPITEYHPVIEFATAQGATIRFTATNAVNINRPSISQKERFTGYGPARQLRDSIEIRYLPSVPENARMDPYLSHWFTPIILVGMGAVLAIGGAVMILRGLR